MKPSEHDHPGTGPIDPRVPAITRAEITHGQFRVHIEPEVATQILAAADAVDPLRHPPADPTDVRAHLARDIFQADNINAREADKGWGYARVFGEAQYAYDIADGLLARGWGRKS